MNRFFIFVLSSTVIGCIPANDNLPRTVKATGVVLCDGTPLEGSAIVLMQLDGNNFARGISDSSGTFSLDAFESKKGAVPGTYKVTISKTVTVDKATSAKVSRSLAEDAQHAAVANPDQANVSWVNDLPDKYNNPTTSGLTITVPENGTSDLKIEISRK